MFERFFQEVHNNFFYVPTAATLTSLKSVQITSGIDSQSILSGNRNRLGHRLKEFGIVSGTGSYGIDSGKCNRTSISNVETRSG